MIDMPIVASNPHFDIPSTLIASKNLDIGDNVNMIVDYEVTMVDENGIRIKLSNIQIRINGRRI